jgi:hypothetical protein
MRRFARHLLTLCSAESLLLCVGPCAPWVRSYSATDMLTLRSESVSGGTYRQVYRLVDFGRGMLLVRAARLRAVGHAAAMYAQENGLFVPFAAYAVSANLVQQPDHTSTPPSSYQLHSGLLVHRYFGDSVEQIFCPSGDEKGRLPQQEMFLPASGAWQVRRRPYTP